MRMTLARRHAQAAILSEMMLVIMTSLHKGYRRKHAAAVAGELMVSFAVRANDNNDKAPITMAQLVKRTGIPYRTVRRIVRTLIRVGMIKHENGGFIGDLDFLRQRLNPPYWRACTKAILTAADALRALDDKPAQK
jgi:predicted transcriptional regulator